MANRSKNSIKPFWSWNDKLEKEELVKQIELMKQNGIEGFFMHARGGLRTEYMSDEWFEMIEVCLDKADELGMQAWAYDENGWPSGFGDGKVPKVGVEHQQKFLHFKAFTGNEENVVAYYKKTDAGFVRTEKKDEATNTAYLEINPYYIDTFNPNTIDLFLKETHGKYYEKLGDRFGTSLKGFFTDEPQFGNASGNFLPWSFSFEEEFKKTYGYSLIDNIPLLFSDEIGADVRNDYHVMASRLFRESFIKRVYDWCDSHGVKFTGHMMHEDNLTKQMAATFGVMSCYEYFHEPGVDWLGRFIQSSCMPKQLGSVACQLDKKTMTETFALCGWDVSLNELKWIAQWQYVNGITSLCPHLEGYSMRGCRKRDYPASLFSQLPWFKHVNIDFADYFTSLGAMLDDAKDIAPLLVIHPLYSAYVLHIPSNYGPLEAYDNDFMELMNSINDEHILHHYGDEVIMERHGSVNGDTITVGKCDYKAVLLPDIVNLSSNTVKMLLEFAENGGIIYAVKRVPEYENGRKTDNILKLANVIKYCDSLTDFKAQYKTAYSVSVLDEEGNCADVHISYKDMSDGAKLLYMVNLEKKNHNITVTVDGKFAVCVLDLLKETENRISCEVKENSTVFSLDLPEYGSAVIKLYAAEDGYTAEEIPCETIKLDKMFDITSRSDNAVTLDKCIYRVDGGEWQPEIAVINLQSELLELQKACDVEMQFSFDVAEEIDFDSINLCVEDPQNYKMVINGEKYDFVDNGLFVDHSIRKSNIGKYLKVGKNTINMSCRFYQSDELYYAKFTPGIHESVLNKLTYDTELESVYLTGNFGVKMAEDYRLGERRCLYGGRTFALTQPETNVDITDITHQNFWFFSGHIDLTQTVCIDKKESVRYKVAFKTLNAPAARIFVNGKFVGNIAFAPFELDITDYLVNGENKITIELLSGNRNLLGPHHSPLGESYYVGPTTFSKEHGWADDPDLPAWTDDYNFVLFGVEL